MPAKKTAPKTTARATKATAPKLDEILETPEEDVKTSSEESAQTESFESAELATLRAELAKANEELAKARTNPTDDAGRPLPEEALTDEQKEIRKLQDELARAKGRNIDEALKEEVEEVGDDGILIHVLADGLTALGRVFYRGQEIVFGPKAYEDTKGRDGRSWLNMSDEEQYDRWGVVRFRKGPWPGKKQYEDKGAEDKSIRTVASVTRF